VTFFFIYFDSLGLFYYILNIGCYDLLFFLIGVFQALYHNHLTRIGRLVAHFLFQTVNQNVSQGGRGGSSRKYMYMDLFLIGAFSLPPRLLYGSLCSDIVHIKQS
jgi:hypothetical protein